MPLSANPHEGAPLSRHCPSCNTWGAHRIYRSGDKTLAWCQHCFRVETIPSPPESTTS
jgi:hypothetical protein